MTAAVATRGRTSAKALGLLGGVLLLAVVVFASLALGSRQVDLDTVVSAILFPAEGNNDHMVVRDLRVPRTILGLVAGAALALGGTLMQGLTRNPLADPGLLGVNAGASLFVVIGITFLGASTAASQVWFALLGAAAATVVVYAVASGRNAPGPVSLTLAGTAVTAALTSVITLLLLRNLDTLNQFRFWSVGSLTGRDLETLVGILPFVLIGIVAAMLLGRTLNVLALGEDVARGLGLNVAVARGVAAIAIVLLCGSATALVGPIVFVGLVVPHIVRRFVGTDYRWLLPYSAIFGAALLVIADVVGRLIVPPGELEAGLVVAFIGAPVMIALVRGRGVSAL